jgi:outer membrane receptor protein involved in Fe transport
LLCVFVCADLRPAKEKSFMKLILRQRLLATTLLVGASAVATPAIAQDAPAPIPTPSPTDNSATPTVPETTAPVEGTTTPSTSAEGENVESGQDIVVTGSRIPQPNLTSASPVTVVSAQEIKLQGTTRTEDLINSLPQSFAAQGSNISNGSTGTATVNLRGLGSARTLVLVNGRRLMPGDPRSPVPDINFIPSSLVKRVDVLTGGASSVYGADAVAGVVNFIMDTNFTGLRIDGQASFFNHNNDAISDVTEAIDARGFPRPQGWSNNGLARDISVALGTPFADDRGHVMAYATYRKQDAVLQSSRDYSACALTGISETAAAAAGREFNCGGSGTSANGTFQLFSPTFAPVGVFQVGPNAADGTGTFIPGNTPFNFGPFNYFQRPNERYTAGAFAEYEISDAAKPYLEAMFMHDKSVAQIAPSGNFGNTTFINCDNPLLSAQQQSIVCAPGVTYTNAAGVTGSNLIILRRNVEGGGRQDDLEHTAFRIVGGVRGDFLRGVSYDAFYQFGKTILAETYLNDFSVRRLGQALDVVADPTTGLPVCRGTLNGTADAGCVPYNIFALGGVTPEALSFLQTPGFQRGDTQETVANANITFSGEEYGLQSPFADRGVGLNVGVEYRKESLNLDTDTAFSTGDLAGQGGPTIGVEGDFDVRDVFAEVSIPLVAENFFHELTLSAGYRKSYYKVADNDFDTDTYKVALEFAPIRDVRLRGSYNRAVRAPNVVELFSAQSVGLSGTTDPCAGPIGANGTVNGFTAAQCALTGVSAAQFGNIAANPADQYNGFLGGNPNLSPETANSITLGAVLQPRFIPGLAVTLDYFNIKVRDVIGTIGFDTIITRCLESGDAAFCSRINRDAFGSLYLTPGGFITDVNSNIGRVRTRGFDVNASYATRVGSYGNANVSLVGTYLKELSADPLGDGNETECRGQFGPQCAIGPFLGTPNPKWRHKLRAGFTFPNGLGISGQWRYFSKVESDSTFPGNDRISAQSFFDLALQARVSDRYNFRVGANNILDKDPPVAGGQVAGAPFGNGNTFPQVYDSLGRYIFAGFTVDF